LIAEVSAATTKRIFLYNFLHESALVFATVFYRAAFLSSNTARNRRLARGAIMDSLKPEATDLNGCNSPNSFPQSDAGALQKRYYKALNRQPDVLTFARSPETANIPE
jgi:CRISPR/Cas system-associated endonuclease Cas1